MLRVVSGLFFFPRGGSSHLARSLSRSLGVLGDRVTLAVGSLGDPGGRSHALTFYEGIDVVPVDYTPGRGLPFQPSYEDRPDAPDPVFAVEPDQTVRAARRRLERRARACGRRRRRRAPPAPSDADPRGGPAAVPGRAGRDRAARDGARDAARDRRGRGVAVRRGVGRADAPLGCGLACPPRRAGDRRRGGRTARGAARAVRRAAGRRRPRALRPAPGRPGRVLAALARGRSRRGGTSRGSPAPSATRRPTSSRSSRAARSCSSSAATRR